MQIHSFKYVKNFIILLRCLDMLHVARIHSICRSFVSKVMVLVFIMKEDLGQSDNSRFRFLNVARIADSIVSR